MKKCLFQNERDRKGRKLLTAKATEDVAHGNVGHEDVTHASLPQDQNQEILANQSFLNALPDDIRREVEHDIKRNSTSATCRSGAGVIEPSTDDNFLGALPEDLRIEIENDMKRQRDELLRVSKPRANHQQKLSAAQHQQQQQPSVSRSFFHVKGSFSTKHKKVINNIKQSASRLGGKRRGRPPGAKNKHKRARNTQRLPASTTNTSSNSATNHKITDIFQVVKTTRSPSNSSSRSSTVLSQDDCSDFTAASSVGGDDDDSDEPNEEDSSVVDVPSLGGATTLEGVREAVRRWTEAHCDSPPLSCDIEDIMTFVKRISVESFNVELASQVIKTLRRSIHRYVFTSQTCGNPDDMFDSEGNVTICETWREVYRKIVSGLQDAIAAQYGNTMLYLPSI